MSYVQAALAEFDKMTRVLKAFEGARAVLDALANAEQVGKELTARNSALAATADELALKAKIAKDAITDAEVRVAEVVKGAERAVEMKVAEGEAKAKEIIEAAMKQKADIDALAEQRAEQAAALKSDADALDQDIAEKRAELARIETALAEARDKLGLPKFVGVASIKLPLPDAVGG